MSEISKIEIQKIPFSDKVDLFLLRLDQIHPEISGNKWYKLKYNLQEAQRQKKQTLLTFGGAYSNHITAVAAAGKEYGLKTIGIIRGEEHLPLNPTLSDAARQGMILSYMDRSTYREKSSKEVINKLRKTFGDFYLIPEGGTNELAVKGTEEIISHIKVDYSYVCCPVGTGGTIAGIINASPGKKVLGFSALKGSFLEEEVNGLVTIENSAFRMIDQYHFGGYAKYNMELVNFINQFKKDYDVQLDPIYTGKMMFGVCDLIEKDYFDRGSSIVAIHTGGLQGIKGFNDRFGDLIK